MRPEAKELHSVAMASCSPLKASAVVAQAGTPDAFHE
jgi:hypothetical protein